ncbi:tripartite tricarboxylate transporter TctB family protein [Mesorhizobium sp. 1B3]|uniref:tripartite tricarboxylate transporter TctB family protein n=1 Tax=Mesorhizobium sp. 1B3 TaxID=3243599 RepID=UPI003D972624
MRISDIVSGGAFALLGLYVVVTAQGFASIGGAISAGLFPTIVGGFLLAGGLAVAARSVLAGAAWPVATFESWMADPRKVCGMVAVPASIALFPLLAPRLGTAAASALIMFGMMLIWKQGVLRSLIAALICSVILTVFFVQGLGVPLPAGVIERFLP